MSDQFAPEYIRAIAPYQAGKPISEVAREFGLDENRIIKLASNENPLGMPESAKKAIANEVGETGRYPDANGFALKKVIGERYGRPIRRFFGIFFPCLCTGCQSDRSERHTGSFKRVRTRSGCDA